MPLMIGQISALVQAYLVTRASRLFGRRRVWRAVFLGVCGVCIAVGWLASLGASIAFFGFIYGFADKMLPLTFNIFLGIFLCLAAAIDVTVTVTLWLTMRKHVLGFNPATDHALRRIMRLAARTAAYTSIFGVAGAMLAVCVKQEQMSDIVDAPFAFDLPLPALYALSLLTTLDSRKPIDRVQTVGVLTRPGATSGQMESTTAVSHPGATSPMMTALSPLQRSLAKLKSPLASARSSPHGSPSLSLAGIQVTREVVLAMDRCDPIDSKAEMAKRRKERYAEGRNQGFDSTSTGRFDFD